MKAETIVRDESRGVRLEAYLQQVQGEFGFARRPAVLILPGGGYTICSDREADPVAMAYMKAGYQAFVLRYTVKSKGGWPLPLDDYEWAMDAIESHADEFGLDKERIAVAGFSAGGHLAACAATMGTHRPKAAVLVYPAILKSIVDLCQPGMPYPAEHVDGAVCPCFIVSARDDRVVPVENELSFEMALAKAGVPFESHIYSYGGHGFSTAEPWVITSEVCPRLPAWVDASIGWLGEVMGSLSYHGFKDPVAAIQLNADTAPVLSIECSIGHLAAQGDAVQAILAPVFEGIRQVAQERGFSEEAVMAGISTSTAREVLGMLGCPEEKTVAIDTALHGVENRLGR